MLAAIASAQKAIKGNQPNLRAPKADAEIYRFNGSDLPNVDVHAKKIEKKPSFLWIAVAALAALFILKR